MPRLFLRATSLCMLLLATSSNAHAQTSAPQPREPGVLSVPRATPPPRIAARDLQLQGSLRALANQAKYRGWLGGAAIAVGCAAIAVGAVYPRNAGPLFFPLGTLALSRGVLGLTLTAGRERQATEYLSLPTYTPDQLRARLQFGEAVLAYQARRARIGRVVEGSVSFLVAASYVPLLWWLQRRDDPSYRFSDDGFGYAVLTLSVINASAALITLFSETGVEQHYRAYKSLVERQEREHPGELQHWTVRPVTTNTTVGVLTNYQF